MTISQRIFEELKKQNKKQKDLAEYIGISTSAVSDWKKKELTQRQKIYPQLRIT